MELKEIIINLVEDYSYKPMLFQELSECLEYKGEKELLLELLEELEEEGKIIRTGKGKYVRPEMANMLTGILQLNERGFGFVIPENGKDDVFVPADYLNGAMNGDKVLVKLKQSKTEGKSSQAEVYKILTRANTKVVGTFEGKKNFGFIISDNKRIGDVYIPQNMVNGAVTGDKVVVDLIEWPERNKSAVGKVVEILGRKWDPGVDILSIAKSYAIETEFPAEVLDEIKTVPEKVLEQDLQGRKDLRHLRIVTIDGEDAKDLDDAISIERLQNDNYLLGVHIADVSHYVKEGHPLDECASSRGTSVYLVDRVIPMLPPKLSNGICSLNAGVDRLAFTVIMEIDRQGNVINHDIYKSVITVSERMTYKDVTKILENEDQELLKRYENHIEDFKIMRELSEILRRKRVARGSIDFDFPEVKIILNDKGKPIEVKRYEITISNKIIEEFMLVCNETVAEKIFWLNMPFIYRIHENPDAEKIDMLDEFLHGLGLSIKGKNNIHPRTLQEVLEKIKGKDEESAVSTLMLRSLQQAKYSHKNDGHFGLAAKYYCHFTSPIRRYPDLFIHRVIGELIKNNYSLNEKRYKSLMSFAVEAARISSEKERFAEKAEREVEDLKKVEFMAERVGEDFEAVVSSVNNFGFFVALDNTIEGLVHVENLKDDYYNFDVQRHCLVGERTNRIFKIGQKVNVRLIKADKEARRLDFMLEDLISQPIINFKKLNKIKKKLKK
ncbi:MAG: ribonuclease R [Ignavibacteriales bacterium]